MAGIKALTNISEGAAQVFDVTPLIESTQEQEKADQELFQKSMLEYDPNDLWNRDIPKVSKDVQEYESWMTSNYERLTAKGGKDRMAAWTEKKAMENKIRNTIAASKQAGKGAQELANLIFTEPAIYDTPENRQLLSEFNKPKSDQEYADYNAFNINGVREKITASAQVPLKDVIDYASDSFFTNKEVRASGNEYLGTKRTLNDEAGLDAYVNKIWEQGDIVGGKFRADHIQGKFKTKDALKQAILDFVPKNVEISYYNPKTGTVSGKKTKSSLYVKDMSSDMQVGAMADTYGTQQYAEKSTGMLWWKGTEKVPVDQADVKTEIVDGQEKQYILDSEGNKQYVKSEDTDLGTVPTVYGLDFQDGFQIDPLSFKVQGVVGGYDTVSGANNEALFEAATNMEITSIGRANYAIKPLYAQFYAKDAKNGNTVLSKKKIERNDIIPAGAKLYADADYKVEIGSSEAYSKINYIQNDIFASVQSTDMAIKEGSGENAYKSVKSEDKGTTGKTKGVVRFSSIQNMIGNSLSSYPGLVEGLGKLSAGKDYSAEIARTKELLNSQK